MESRDHWLHGGGESVGEGVSVKDTWEQGQGDGMVGWWTIYGGFIPGPWWVRLTVCYLKKQQTCHESQTRQSTTSQVMCVLRTKGGEKELC